MFLEGLRELRDWLVYVWASCFAKRDPWLIFISPETLRCLDELLPVVRQMSQTNEPLAITAALLMLAEAGIDQCINEGTLTLNGACLLYQRSKKVATGRHRSF